MRVPRTSGAVLVACVLLLTGCTGGDDPQEATPTAPAPTASSSDDDLGPALVFSGGSSASVQNECGDRSPVWFEVAVPVQVTREVRLDEVSVDGSGTLVRGPLIAPGGRRRDGGVISAGPRPGFEMSRRKPHWEQRAPLTGQEVRPGRHTVFLQVRLRAGEALEGFDVAWTDAGTTGTARLDHGLGVDRGCS